MSKNQKSNTSVQNQKSVASVQNRKSDTSVQIRNQTLASKDKNRTTVFKIKNQTLLFRIKNKVLVKWNVNTHWTEPFSIDEDFQALTYQLSSADAVRYYADSVLKNFSKVCVCSELFITTQFATGRSSVVILSLSLLSSLKGLRPKKIS